jgi:hypothetical protein
MLPNPILGFTSLPEVFGPSTLGLSVIVYGVVVFLIHIIMALAVNGDAKSLVSGRGGLFLFGPFLWGWIVLIFGLAGLALYWAIHHSTLRASAPPHARLTNGEQDADGNPH